MGRALMAATERAHQALDVIGGKWVADILDQLSDGPLRYSELQTRIPDVASSVLTRTLDRWNATGW